ncbi:MAG: hypothetical protein JNL98_08435 [Bryobacterales bacterium]|nr:hypothetical protein [Bryobacterales bacterium]
MDSLNVQVCATRATKWLAANLHEFNPEGERESKSKLRSKALVELALLAAYRKKLGDTALCPDYERIVAAIHRYASEPGYWQTCARDNRALLLYGLTYAGLRTCGHEVPEFRHTVANAIRAGAMQQERLPYRQLDLLHFLELAGFKAPWSYREVCKHTLLCSDPNVVTLSDSDAYAITHALFYMTDFGLRDGDFCARFQRARAVELVEQMLRIYIERENPDLVGELICSLYCLQAPHTSLLTEAWNYLVGIQRDDGHIPGPQHIVPESEGIWKSAYHTTIVFVLAALMRARARSRRLPPAANNFEHWETLRVGGEWLASQLDRADVRTGLRLLAGLGMIAGSEAWSHRWESAVSGFLSRNELRPDDVWSSGGETLVWAAVCVKACGQHSEGLMEVAGRIANGLTRTAVEESPAVIPLVRALSRVTTLPPGVRDACGTTTNQSSAVRLLDHIREYRFTEAAMECRGREPDQLTRDALRWFASQQREDGSFGYPCQSEVATVKLNWTLAAISAFSSSVERELPTGSGQSKHAVWAPAELASVAGR